MNISVIIIIFVTSVLTKEIRHKRKNSRANTISLTIMGVIVLLMIGFSTFNYFNTSTNINEFNIIEKVYEDKGISIYTILEDGEEKYLVLKSDGVFDTVFLHCKAPVQDGVVTYVETFKYKHQIDIENSIVSHTYKKRWGDGVLSFWLVLAMGVCNIEKDKKLSKADKIVGTLWLVITVGVTIFFMTGN